MSTVGAVLDRLYRTYLEPPDYQPVLALLSSSVNDITTSIPIASFTVPEDEQLLRINSLLECERELMRITAYDGASKTATVVRGVEGTTADAHSTDDVVKINPPFPRESAFQAVADNILTLHPTLYTVLTKNISAANGNIGGIDDNLAIDVIEIWPDHWNISDENFDARIVDYHPAVGGRAVITNIWTGAFWIKYRRRMGTATAETNTLDDLGVDERWSNIVMAGAAADLLVGRDISRSHTEWVGQVLEAESIRVGTRQSIGFGLAQYRDLLLKRAGREMSAEYKPKVHMRNALRTRTRGGLG